MRTKNKCRTASICAILLILCAAPCAASISLTGDVNIIDFGIATVWDLDTGYIERTASDLTYALRLDIADTGSTNWILYTHASAANFTSFSGVKSCSDLQWRLNQSGTYTAYTTIDEAVASGNGNNTLDLDFRLLMNWADKPGSYSIDVVFTVIEN